MAALCIIIIFNNILNAKLILPYICLYGLDTTL